MRLKPAVCLLVMFVAVGSAQLPALGKSPERTAAAPAISNMPYQPDPAITAIPPQPDPAAIPKPNPKGNYNAYDLNAYETLWFPERQAGDESPKDPPGGAIDHGTCPEGGCPNHQLEFVRFWKKTMRPLVKPFGGVARSYKFFSPGNGLPEGGYLASPEGDTFNLQAVIPGAVHPEQMVIVSGHFDQTDSGPGSAWDSAEGHATVFRIAKIMTDYWRKTGTRPAVSVKFSAWGAEEAGTFGSQAYIRDNLLPFPRQRVRGYFNLDPCGGGYPAYYRGNPTDRVPLVMQLMNPEDATSPVIIKRVENFNKQARVVLGDVFNHLDDHLTDVPTEPEIFVSDEEAEKAGVASQEDEVVVALGGLALFSSDYANFEEIGVPIMNLFADVLGPHADRNYTGYREDGIAILHTPQDNLKTLNALTGVDQTGLVPSQGWYKGLEMCAHLHGWFLLQPSMGGSVRRTSKPVVYFEGIPKGPAPIKPKTPITFDARGTYAFSNATRLKKMPRHRLKLRWTFGDGSKARRYKVRHAYKKAGTYTVTLTVRAPGGRVRRLKQFVNVGS